MAVDCERIHSRTKTKKMLSRFLFTIYYVLKSEHGTKKIANFSVSLFDVHFLRFSIALYSFIWLFVCNIREEKKRSVDFKGKVA